MNKDHDLPPGIGPARLAHPSAHAAGCRSHPLGQGLWSRVLDVGLVLWVLRVPLLSVAVGLLMMASVTQAQDTLVDVAMAGAPLAAAAGLSPAIIALVAATFMLWAVPLHYAGRLLLETDAGIAALRRRRDEEAVATHGPGASDEMTGLIFRQAPRLLGALTFVAFAIGAWKAIGNLPDIADAPVISAARAQLRLISAVMLAAVPLFLLYAVIRSRLVRAGPLHRADLALGHTCAGLFRVLGIAPAREEQDGELHATGRLTLLLYALGVIVVLVANPLWLARQLPLAMAVPLIFGGWVPIAAYFSSIGRRYRVPFLTALLAAGAVGVYVLGDNHQVRTLAAGAKAEARTDLKSAIALWMQANGCTAAPASCPRPIIIAAAGGASRAGFFTASVIGHFLDFSSHQNGFTLTRADGSQLVRQPLDDGRISAQAAETLKHLGTQDLKGMALGHSPPDIAERIFAISGVSGGAYGAAVVAAALDARTGGAPPCASGPRPYWFGASVANWADCLESLTSGDYLTATFFGLAFHDQVQAFLEDRAALLEQAWEARFADIIRPAGAGQRMALPFLTTARDPGRWVPFLVLNGTSVETGQRIITTDLKTTYDARQPCPSGGRPERCPIFTHAIDFHDLIPGDRDVRLSTAALNSARFPAISPPGSIFKGDGDIADRIVDGGYFENYGAESALELAQAMVDLEPALAPFILVISNDPESTLTEERTAQGAVVPDADEHVWASELTGPLGAIATVRGGRGRLAVAKAQAWLTARFGERCGLNLARIKVCPEARNAHCPLDTDTRCRIREISMSWWLSKPVQMNLREQLEGRSRQDQQCDNDKDVAAVWTALATPSGRCQPVP